MTTIDMTLLETSFPRLHRMVVKQLGLRQTSGEVEIDLHRLEQYTHGEIFGWLAAQKLPDIAAAKVKSRAGTAEGGGTSRTNGTADQLR